LQFLLYALGLLKVKQVDLSDALLTIGSAFPTLKQAEDFLVEEGYSGVQSHAARLLGITPSR
jgi:hypothetical protein